MLRGRALCGWLIVLLLAEAGALEGVFKHRVATPQLPLNHERLRRSTGAGPHTPEQVHVSFAGPSAAYVSWVTWPQDGRGFAGMPDTEQGDALSSSRKLLLDVLDLGRHHRHHHRHRHHCKLLRTLGLESVVQWGTAPGKFTRSASGSFECYSSASFDSGALHHVTIGEAEGPLPAGQRIFYRVGDPKRGKWSEEFSVMTAPAVGSNSLPYRFGLLGDLGQTHNSLSTLLHLREQQPDSVMLVGDLSYADGYQPRWDTWGRLVSSFTNGTVWMFAEGNHEIEPEDGVPDFQGYFKRFRFPYAASGSPSPHFYSYNVAAAHVIMLGSYTDFDVGSPQFEWARRDLAAVDRSVTPWVIVGMHAPWYNSNYNHYGEGEAMREEMEALLYEHGVDLVISGHVHAYERSARTYNFRREACGPVYVNVGDGGNREGLDFDYYEQPRWSAYREPSYGHGTLDLLNATHARLLWHRNQDGSAVVGDDAWLVRDERCSGEERSIRLTQLLGSKR